VLEVEDRPCAEGPDDISSLVDPGTMRRELKEDSVTAGRSRAASPHPTGSGPETLIAAIRESRELCSTRDRMTAVLAVLEIDL
jgi:hypothetical protein